MTNASDNAGELLREVARLYTRAQRSVAEACQTTNAQCHILTELGRSRPVTMTELGARLLLEKSWISRAVESLVERNLVTKKPNSTDARSWIVALTPAGRVRVRNLNRTLDEQAEELLASLGAGDRKQLHHALKALVTALRDEPGSGQSRLGPARRTRVRR